MTNNDDWYYKIRTNEQICDLDWSKRVDPDGRIRIRSTERLLAVQDSADAVDFLAKRCNSILDFGCGFGFAAAQFPEHVGVICVEPDQFSREHAKSLNLIVLEDTSSLIDASFDGALSWNVLEHVRFDAYFKSKLGPLGYLLELRRLIRIGGWLVLQTPNFESEIAKEWGSNYRQLNDPTHVSLFGELGLLRALRDTGWIVRDKRYDYLRTRHNTFDNNARLSRLEGVSPPGIGNIITVYAQSANESQQEILSKIGRLEREIY